MNKDCALFFTDAALTRISSRWKSLMGQYCAKKLTAEYPPIWTAGRKALTRLVTNARNLTIEPDGHCSVHHNYLHGIAINHLAFRCCVSQYSKRQCPSSSSKQRSAFPSSSTIVSLSRRDPVYARLAASHEYHIRKNHEN